MENIKMKFLKMKNRAKFMLLIAVLFGIQYISASSPQKQNLNKQWSNEKANAWYATQPWPSGCNYIPNSAINQIEMWQADTFDGATIDKELSWAEELGFNTMRVFLSSVVWKNDAEGFKKRIDQFLAISAKHNIRTIFVFFDDCWNDESHIGKQPDPKPGIHNSGWVQDPSVSLRKDTTSLYPVLGKYVKDILTTFGNDKRVLMWDLYNEPGNSNHGITSLALLKNVFKWAREVSPSQPVSSGIWYFGCNELNAFQVGNSDIITYHNYSGVKDHQTEINYLKMFNRPMICTEYMARKYDSKFENIMPLLKRNHVGAINWGFVSGKTNTIFAWDEPMPTVKEPKLWFHDIFRQDHTPFDQNEINIIKNLNGKDQGIKLIKNADFKGIKDGKEVLLYTLKNNSGMVAQITNFGGRVVALWTPDRYGKFADIVTGYNHFSDYEKSNEVFFGALIGRYGNRIANGKFTLDGKPYQLPINNGKNTLHGGPNGFHNVVWNARQFKNENDEDALELKYLSPDGEEGFQGNLSVTVVYTLTNQNELKIEYSATTDKPTVINLTHHSFFNLHGFSDGVAQTINTHILQINGSTYTPTDDGLIPTGKIDSVRGTPLDFTTPTPIGKRVNEPFQALIFAKGYDHNWILDKKQGEITEAAVIYEPSNGREMRVITDQPALQFYGGNFFEGKDTGKYSEVYNYRTSFALETQHYPDSPNHANFPSTVLNPGETYHHICVYKFDIVK
jgi:galactose mutarotase-like enzyme